LVGSVVVEGPAMRFDSFTISMFVFRRRFLFSGIAFDGVWGIQWFGWDGMCLVLRDGIGVFVFLDTLRIPYQSRH
jgi:hypothetical protein